MLSLRGLAWVWGRTVVLTLVATLAVASAAASAVYIGAAMKDVVDLRIGAAPAPESGLSLVYLGLPTGFEVHDPKAPQSPLAWAQAAGAFLDKREGLASGLTPTVLHVGTPAPTEIRMPKGRVEAYVGWRAGQCDHLTFVAGRCPAQAGEFALAAKDAAHYGVAVGMSLPGVVRGVHVRVTGLYTVPDQTSSYWYGGGYFQRVPARIDPRRGEIPPTIAALLISRADADELTSFKAGADKALTDDRPSITRLAALAGAMQRADTAFSDHPVAGSTLQSWSIETRLPALVAQADKDLSVIKRRALLVDLPLLIIAWYLLYVLVRSNAEQQQTEVALAKLRGHRLRSTALFALSRPACVLLLAGPLGLVISPAVMRVVAGPLVGPDAVFTLDRTAVGAAGVAMAGGITASLLALVTVLKDPVGQQLRRVRPTARGRSNLVVGTIICVVAGTGAIESATLRGSADRSALGLLAPGLLALVLGILGAQLLVLAARLWGSRTIRSRRLAGFLASRHIMRRAGSGRSVVLVVTTVGLSLFASNAWWVGIEHRDDQARAEVGAPLAYPVAGGSMQGLLSATRALDPSGRHLMAVAILADPGRPLAERRLAVDARRLAEVAEWDPSWSRTNVVELARALRGQTTTAVSFRARQLQIGLRDAHLKAAAPVRLVAHLVTASGREVTAFFGVLRPGPGLYQATATQCASGCQLEDLALDRWLQPMNVRGGFTLASISADGRPVDAELSGPGRWRPGLALEPGSVEGPAVTLKPGDSGLRVNIATKSETQPITLTTSDVSAVIPAVITGGGANEKYGDPGPIHAYDGHPGQLDPVIVGAGFDGQEQPLELVATANTLPRLGSSGVALDLEDVIRNGSNPVNAVKLEVWASNPVGAPLAREFEKRGLHLGGPSTVAERRAQLATTPDAVTLNLYLLCAFAAVILAVTGLGALVLTDIRRRSYELAALRVAGVDVRTLRRAVAWETYAILAPAIPGTALAGWAASRLASLEQNGFGAGLQSAGLGSHWATFLTVAGGAFALLVAVGWLAGRRATSGSDLDILRGSAHDVA